MNQYEPLRPLSEVQQAWERFEYSGSIHDYLSYKNVIASGRGEIDYDNQNKSDCPQGAELGRK